MTAESQFFAKQQQIALIDNILANLCPAELTNDGRKYLNKLKKRILEDMSMLNSNVLEKRMGF
ncbi:MAG: hypothetical protein V1783_08935 [Bacteroidota bacterium]|jgi:hypothetical protein